MNTALDIPVTSATAFFRLFPARKTRRKDVGT